MQLVSEFCSNILLWTFLLREQGVVWPIMLLISMCFLKSCRTAEPWSTATDKPKINTASQWAVCGIAISAIPKWNRDIWLKISGSSSQFRMCYLKSKDVCPKVSFCITGFHKRAVGGTGAQTQSAAHVQKRWWYSLKGSLEESLESFRSFYTIKNKTLLSELLTSKCMLDCLKMTSLAYLMRAWKSW